MISRASACASVRHATSNSLSPPGRQSMGIYDREYIRNERPSWFTGLSVVGNLILLNVVVFVAEWLLGWQSLEVLALTGDLLHEPWKFWELLTYGFLHNPNDLMHIVFNMLGLWFFGRDLEDFYGPKEF